MLKYISLSSRCGRNFYRSISIEAIERAVGRQAANHFIQSMEQNSKLIVSIHFLHKLLIITSLKYSRRIHQQYACQIQRIESHGNGLLAWIGKRITSNDSPSSSFLSLLVFQPSTWRVS